MNLFTGKNFKSDDCIFDVHSFATELDEDTLRTKVNGGCCDASAPSAPPAPPAGNNPPSAPAVTATTPTTNPGTSPTTNTPNPSDPSNPGSGYTGGGYEPPPEVMSNPQAYGYWKALQALAEQQGDPDRYKDYNVLGNGSVPIKTLRSFKEQKAFNEKDEHCDIYAWNEAVKQGKDPRGQNREALDLNQIKVDPFLKAFPNERYTKPLEGTQGYVFFDWEKDGKYDHMEYYMAGNGNVIRMKTDGILTPKPKLYSIDDTKYGSNDADIIFVPLPNRWERY